MYPGLADVSVIVTERSVCVCITRYVVNKTPLGGNRVVRLKNVGKTTEE